MTETTIESPLARLSDEEIEKIGEEFETIGNEVFDSLGDRDRRYIVAMIEMHRRMLVASRAILAAGEVSPALVAGTTLLSLAKILENMEIRHNVMHGQWDWMNDPHIHSSTWDWDTASTKEAWKHSHNYIHHTYTNIRGKDKDLGYEIMRIDPHQKWHPAYLTQPIYNLLLMAFFEWGVAFHDLDLDAVRAGEKSHKQVLEDVVGISGKMRDQVVKDYIAWPILSGIVGVAIDAAWAAAHDHDLVRTGRRAKAKRKGKALIGRARRKAPATSDNLVGRLVERRSFREPFKRTLWANFWSNIIRNVWAHAIIFCGHFPDQTYTFSQEETEDESRGAAYVRQLIGAANIEGSPFFHVMSGNLGYQVEHHLFPDMPSTRYGEIAPRVREICKKYELPYNTGPLVQQWSMVHRTIARLAFPGGKPRKKPGPYEGEIVIGRGESRDKAKVGSSSNGSSNGSSDGS